MDEYNVSYAPPSAGQKTLWKNCHWSPMGHKMVDGMHRSLISGLNLYGIPLDIVDDGSLNFIDYYNKTPIGSQSLKSKIQYAYSGTNTPFSKKLIFTHRELIQT